MNYGQNTQVIDNKTIKNDFQKFDYNQENVKLKKSFGWICTLYRNLNNLVVRKKSLEHVQIYQKKKKNWKTNVKENHKSNSSNSSLTRLISFEVKKKWN